MLEIFKLLFLFFFGVGALGTAYVLRNGLNQMISGMEAMNKQLSDIEQRLKEKDNQ